MAWSRDYRQIFSGLPTGASRWLVLRSVRGPGEMLYVPLLSDVPAVIVPVDARTRMDTK